MLQLGVAMLGIGYEPRQSTCEWRVLWICVPTTSLQRQGTAAVALLRWRFNGHALRQRRPVAGAAAAFESGTRSELELVLLPGCLVQVLLVLPSS